MGNIFRKTIYEKRFFILGWTVGFIALAALMATFFPAMRPEGGIDQLLQNLPPAFSGLIGDLSALRQFDTYIASQLFDIRVPLIAGIMAIILGLGLSVSDEETGELRTVLATPTSRTSILFGKWLALVTILAVAVVGMAVGLVLVMPFVADATIGPEVLARLLLATWLVMITYGTVPFAMGMAFGKRGVASSVAITVIIGSFLLSTFGAAVDWLASYERLSLLYYFPAVEIVRNGLDFTNVLVYVLLTSGLLAIAWLRFRRRDVA